jgi:hypothetical protein
MWVARASLAAPVAESSLMYRGFSYNILTEFSLPGFTMFFQKRQDGRSDGQGGRVMTGCRKRRTNARPWSGAMALAGLCLIGAAFGTAGCEDRVLQTGLKYEYWEGYLVDPAPTAASETPSPIRPLSGRNPDYPSLYTVPMRPAPVPTVSERKTALDEQQKAVDALDADRRAGRSADEQLQEVAPPPLPVPPPPPGVGAPTGAKTAASSPAPSLSPALPVPPGTGSATPALSPGR